MTITSLFEWFAGNGRYMTLFHCMGHDRLWVGITVGLDLLVASGYALIARHWWINQRLISESPAKRALGSMRNIFVFCGICGYLFIPIKMLWPAWRLYDIVLLFLVYSTWRYALSAKSLGVVYSELNRSARLAEDLETTRADARRRASFLNAISHDLRTPLNGLMLQAELAEIGVQQGDTETLIESLAVIKASAKVTAELLNSFLEVGRLDWSGEERVDSVIDLAELLTGAVRVDRAEAERSGLYLRVGAVPENIKIRTDRVKLERALHNLIGNGIKFTHSGGVELNASVAGSDVAIHVTDTGVGISPDDQKHLFQEFFQVNNRERDRRKGFGLGLAITRRLAEQLGGSILVQSESGNGSRFSVRLPGVTVRDEPAQSGSPARAVIGAGV